MFLTEPAAVRRNRNEKREYKTPAAVAIYPEYSPTGVCKSPNDDKNNRVGLTHDLPNMLKATITPTAATTDAAAPNVREAEGSFLSFLFAETNAVSPVKNAHNAAADNNIIIAETLTNAYIP